jgi:hypothetical protein
MGEPDERPGWQRESETEEIRAYTDVASVPEYNLIKMAKLGVAWTAGLRNSSWADFACNAGPRWKNSMVWCPVRS